MQRAPVGEVCHIVPPWSVSSSFTITSTYTQLLLERCPLGTQRPESKTSCLIPFLLTVSRSVPGKKRQSFDALRGPRVDHICQERVLVGDSPGVYGLQPRLSSFLQVRPFFLLLLLCYQGFQLPLTGLFVALLCSISS